MSSESVSHLPGLHVDGKPPSGLHVWLQSCQLQTLQSTVSCLQIQDAFTKTFVDLVKSRNDLSSVENLALFQLLGVPFMVKYLPNIKVEPCTSEPSSQILQEMYIWLKKQLQVVANEFGSYSNSSGDTSSKKTCDEIQKLRRHISTVAQNNLDLLLLKDEQERKKNKINNDNNCTDSLLGVVNAVPQLQSRRGSQGNRKSPEQVAHVQQVPCDDDDEFSPEIRCSQSELIGEIVSSILLKHPSKTTQVISTLSGYRLPASLRRHFWREVLFQSQKHLLKKGNVEQFLRLEFVRTIQQNCQELKIKHATKSPINCLIENAVIEIYSKIPILQKFETDAHLKETCRVLNVLYVYDRTYQPHLIQWLLALQITFLNDSKDPVQIGEHVYELAMYLTLLRTSCFPSDLHVLNIARQVMDILKEHDSLLHKHLYEIAKTNLHEDQKEILVQDYLVSKGKKKMEIVSSELKHLGSFSMDYLAPSDPVFYIYKWIREGFVTVLDTAAMLWIWDQCFLQHWNPKVLCDVSVALILLLRSYFLDATDSQQMKKVFLNHPLQRFTKDIRKAWLHIQDQRPLVEIPEINRQHFQEPFPWMHITSIVGQKSMKQSYKRADIQIPDPFSSLENLARSRSMTSFILEDVHLKLEFLPSVLQESKGKIFQMPWTKSPNMNNIVIEVQSQFSQTTIASKRAAGPHTELKTKVDAAGRLTLVLSVDGTFRFPSYDTVQYKSEVTQGEYPFIIVTVYYVEGDNIAPLGWACISLVELEAWNNQKWPGIQHQLKFFPLHPGDVPVEVCGSETATPGDQINLFKYLLGYNSELFLTLSIDGQGTMDNGEGREPS